MPDLQPPHRHPMRFHYLLAIPAGLALLPPAFYHFQIWVDGFWRWLGMDYYFADNLSQHLALTLSILCLPLIPLALYYCLKPTSPPK